MRYRHVFMNCFNAVQKIVDFEFAYISEISTIYSCKYINKFMSHKKVLEHMYCLLCFSKTIVPTCYNDFNVYNWLVIL
jgi:hypothetical protein